MLARAVPAFVILMASHVFAEAPTTQPQEEKNWEAAKGEGFALIVPRGWRSFDRPPGRMKLHLTGDGIGVPMVDETGAPLQIGMTVECFPNTKDAPADGAAALVKNAKRNPRMELVGKETTEKVTLADKSEGLLLVMEFIKDGSRRSLQMKMLVKDSKDNGWVVSGFLVGGKESKWPTHNGVLIAWLKSHMTSFVLDADKLDEAGVREAHAKLDKAMKPE
jgi:hypothetical protein